MLNINQIKGKFNSQCRSFYHSPVLVLRPLVLRLFSCKVSRQFTLLNSPSNFPFNALWLAPFYYANHLFLMGISFLLTPTLFFWKGVKQGMGAQILLFLLICTLFHLKQRRLYTTGWSIFLEYLNGRDWFFVDGQRVLQLIIMVITHMTWGWELASNISIFCIF